MRGEWADGDNHISRLADSSSDEISYFFEDEIPDEGDDDGDGDGDENTRNLSLAEPGLLDKKIDEMMEMMTSIMSMLEIWDEGHGDDDRRDLSPARTDSRDEKIDKLMEMIRSIAPMLEALSERLNRIEVDIAVMKRVNMNKLKVTESPLFKQRIEEAVQHDVAG